MMICAYCRSLWHDDGHGGCSACGAPYDTISNLPLGIITLPPMSKQEFDEAKKTLKKAFVNNDSDANIISLPPLMKPYILWL